MDGAIILQKTMISEKDNEYATMRKYSYKNHTSMIIPHSPFTMYYQGIVVSEFNIQATSFLNAYKPEQHTIHIPIYLIRIDDKEIINSVLFKMSKEFNEDVLGKCDDYQIYEYEIGAIFRNISTCEISVKYFKRYLIESPILFTHTMLNDGGNQYFEFDIHPRVQIEFNQMDVFINELQRFTYPICCPNEHDKFIHLELLAFQMMQVINETADSFVPVIGAKAVFNSFFKMVVLAARYDAKITGRRPRIMNIPIIE